MRVLIISAIVFVAVIMGLSVVAPMIPPAFAHDVGKVAPGFGDKHIICEKDVLPPAIKEFICNHPPPD